MRRQVKPFVTEYRGSTRRTRDLPKDLADTGDHQAGVARGRASEGQRAADVPDDSYEAAMRAADALFAPAPRPRDPAPPASEPANVALHDAPSAPEIAPPPEEPGVAKPDSARRILQAIEPPTEDRFAALEAERAPKRRGRKPGSKNKPKIVVPDDWASQAARATAVPPRGALAETFAETIEPGDTAASELDDDLVPLADEAAMPSPRGRTDRFGWKRSGLRPGERWKRRLPKIAW